MKMMGSSINSQASTSVSRRATCRVAAVGAQRPVPRGALRRAEHSRRHHERLVFVHAADESTTTTAAPDEVSTSEQSNGHAEQQVNPIQAAREALEAEDVDRVGVEAALTDLDAEIARLNDVAAAAESRAAVLENTVATAKDQLLRLNADFDNFRRRSQTEKDALADSVRGDVVQQLLPLIDNFELARTQVKAETESEQKINNSYQGLYKQMVDIMRSLGIEAVPTTGTPFDPEIHEAIMREPNNEVADGTVLTEFRKGFRLGDKLLRAAMVKVSVNDEGAPTNSSEE